MFEIATPISSLFKSKEEAQLIMSYSDCLECRDHSPSVELNKQKLFHCEIQPIHELCEKDFAYIASIKNGRRNLELVSFHMATCCNQPVLQNKIFTIGGKIYSELEMYQNAKKNISRIKSIFGSEINIAIENNNFYSSDAYNIVTMPDFICEIVIENNIYFLLDIAHAHISAHNMKIDYENYLRQLPLEKIIQLHICKHDFNNEMAFDAHLLPDEQVFLEIQEIILKSKSLKYFTVEYYKDTTELLQSLIYLKKVLVNNE
jgi:uncharacterized protein (UPF0276 family)